MSVKPTKIEVASDMMSHPPLCLSPGTPILEAARMLVRKHIHGAPVVNDDGELVGMISEVELLKVVAGAAFHALPAGNVAEFMSADVTTVGDTTDIYEITKLFREGVANRLVVMRGQRCVGIITRRNLLLALQRLADFHETEPHDTYAILTKLYR